MHNLIATVISALLFTAAPMPPNTATTGFTLEGYTVPSGCVFANVKPNCDPSLVADPSFEPETDAFRPAARASFVPDFTGDCTSAEVETLNGEPQVIPALAGHVSVTRGERAFVGWVLYDADERKQNGVDPSNPYEIGLMCQTTDGTVVWSSFYEIALPEAS